MRYEILLLNINELKKKPVKLYDETMQYNTGNLALYAGTVYKCKANATKGNWDSSKWDSTDYDTEFSWLEEQLHTNGSLNSYDVVSITLLSDNVVCVTLKLNGD